MKDSDNPINYGLKSSYDLYQKLIFEEKRLSNNADWSNYDFFNFHVTATHLFDDWLKKEKQSSTLLQQKIKATPKEMFDVFQVLRDLTNGNKHKTLDKPSEKKRITTIAEPVIDDYYSYFFARYAIKTSQSSFQVWDLAKITLNYFHWLFDETAIDIFPNEIAELIEHCKVSN